MSEPSTTDQSQPQEPAGDAKVTTRADLSASDEALDVDALRRERDEYRDWLLRKTAEFDNYRKRVDRERRELEAFALAGVLHELLPLVDDFERALQTDPASGVEAFRTGVGLIHKQLMDLLRKRGVTPIETLGKTFDPHVHQAVAHEASADHREGEIIAEFRRGYMLGDRLLRAAMVKVAKA